MDTEVYREAQVPTSDPVSPTERQPWQTPVVETLKLEGSEFFNVQQGS